MKDTSTEGRTLNVTSDADAKAKISDIEILGVPDHWVLLLKASSKSQKWSKSTKAMRAGNGVIVQATTVQNGQVAEALVFVPNATIEDDENGGHQISTM